MGSVSSKTTTPVDSRFTCSERLLDNEQALLAQGPSPIGTVSWIEGDAGEAVTVLRERLRGICVKNPWLTGRIVLEGKKKKKKKEAHLAYPSQIRLIDDVDLIEPLFQIFDGPFDASFHHEETDFTKTAKLLTEKGVLLRPKRDMEQPLLLVCVVPSSRISDNGNAVFGVVVSMSHVTVDGHGYYQIYNALMNETEASNMPRLEVYRVRESIQIRDEVMGKADRVFLAPGHIAGLLFGLLYDVFMWPFMKSRLVVEKRIVYIDNGKMEAYKKTLLIDNPHDGVSFVSTNDVITSWFLTRSKANFGFMAFNLRDRLRLHGNSIAGNYSDLLYYRVPEDSQTPALIRSSIQKLRRASTFGRKPTFFEMASKSHSLVTNWATFASGTVKMNGMKMLHHYPMFDLTANVMPSTMAVCVIFRATKKRIGVLYGASLYRMQDLGHAPFLEEQP